MKQYLLLLEEKRVLKLHFVTLSFNNNLNQNKTIVLIAHLLYSPIGKK